MGLFVGPRWSPGGEVIEAQTPLFMYKLVALCLRVAGRTG